MIDPKHLYTLHSTYTGAGCAMCGKPASEHDATVWLVNGEKTPQEQASEADTRTIAS